jgi:hypothetical protein
MSLARSFAALRICFAGFCPAIAGSVLDDEFPSSGIFMNHAAYFTDELIRAALGNAQNPSRVANRSWLAVVDSYRLRHRCSINRRSTS